MQYLVADLSLTRHHTLIFFDQRGSGRSTVPTDTAHLNWTQSVSDLETVREHFKLNRLTLIGHSWGGLLAGLYARDLPGRVTRLLLIDSDPPKRAPCWSQFRPRSRLSAADQRRLDSLSVSWRAASDTAAGCRACWGLFIEAYLATPSSKAMLRGDVCDTPQSPMLNPNRAYARRSLGDLS